MISKNVTYDNIKSLQKAELHPLSRKHNFGKTTRVVNLTFPIILWLTWDSSYEKNFQRILTHMETSSKKLSCRVYKIYLMIKRNSCTCCYLWYNVNRRGDSKNSTTLYRIISWEFSKSYKSNTVQKGYFKLTTDIFS